MQTQKEYERIMQGMDDFSELQAISTSGVELNTSVAADGDKVMKWNEAIKMPIGSKGLINNEIGVRTMKVIHNHMAHGNPNLTDNEIDELNQKNAEAVARGDIFLFGRIESDGMMFSCYTDYFKQDNVLDLIEAVSEIYTMMLSALIHKNDEVPDEQ